MVFLERRAHHLVELYLEAEDAKAELQQASRRGNVWYGIAEDRFRH